MTLPPYAQALGLVIEESADGPRVLVPGRDDLQGRPGFLHGGAIAGILEVAAIVALRHALGEAGTALKPVNVTVDYRRGGRIAETRARGEVTRLGKRVANVEAVAWQDDPAQPIATARMNVLLKRGG